MNTSISVVIICNNEAHIIARTIAAAQQFTDDIVGVGRGSTYGTQPLVTAKVARLMKNSWEGYGINKNKVVG